MSTSSNTIRRMRRPTHPGAILREDVLPALDISVSEAARSIGVTRQTLHRILAETNPITPEMALRIGKFCGNGPDIWLAMQQAVDLWDAGARIKAAIGQIKTRKVAATGQIKTRKVAAPKRRRKVAA